MPEPAHIILPDISGMLLEEALRPRHWEVRAVEAALDPIQVEGGWEPFAVTNGLLWIRRQRYSDEADA